MPEEGSEFDDYGWHIRIIVTIKSHAWWALRLIENTRAAGV
jgi:hypothetical protein